MARNASKPSQEITHCVFVDGYRLLRSFRLAATAAFLDYLVEGAKDGE
jgi:hypothetical protein